MKDQIRAATKSNKLIWLLRLGPPNPAKSVELDSLSAKSAASGFGILISVHSYNGPICSGRMQRTHGQKCRMATLCVPSTSPDGKTARDSGAGSGFFNHVT